MAYSRTAANVFLALAPGGHSVLQMLQHDDADIKNIYSILNTLSGGKIPYRQTVLTGGVAADGNPNFLTPSGLTVTLSASAAPVVLSFAAGYDSSGGAVDYLSRITADVANAWNLPPTQTCYLYIERDAATGTLTYGYTTLAPSYATTKPTTPAAGQFWYSPVLQYAQVYNGSSWDIRQRLVVAKAVTAASSVALTYTGLTTDAIINQVANDLQAKYDAVFGLTWTQGYSMTNPANGYVSPPLPLTRNAQGKSIQFRPDGAVSAATSIYTFAGDGTLTLNGAVTAAATTMTLKTAITFAAPAYAVIDATGSAKEVVQMTAGSGTTSITIVRGQLGTTAAAHNAGSVVLPTNLGSVSISDLTPLSLSTTTVAANADDLFSYVVSGGGLAGANVIATQKWGNR